MSGDAWNPAQYERYRDERSQPFLDLLALVRPGPGLRVIDLGCGTGELTRRLHDQLQAAHTVGVDRSANMLAQAARHATAGLAFRQADIRDVAEAGSFDLVFSNAALQWLPDHDALFGRLTALLSPRGQLAVQVPAMYAHPSHTVAAEVARQPAFRDALGGFVHDLTVRRPDEYAVLLDRLGFARQQVLMKVYGHRLPGPDAVVDWMRGTLLTVYQERLAPEMFERFLTEYASLLLPRLEDRRPFFYPFQRILMWAGR